MAGGRISLVVMASPRSGTLHMVRILNACGLRTFHERYYRPGDAPTAWRYDGPYAEVSAAAYACTAVQSIPRRSLVLHQTRHPVKSINSLFATSHCRWDKQGTHTNKDPQQIAWDKLYLRACGSMEWNDDRLMRCAQFWHIYNKRIGEYVQSVKGWQYQIEQISVDLICRIFDRIGIEPDIQRIEKVIGNVSTTINRIKAEPNHVFEWSMLTRQQKQFAALCGYNDR